jgi:predicted restriction endonuclease
MDKLELFLSSQENDYIYKSDLEDFTQFGYDDETRFNHHLSFLLENCYQLKLVDKPDKTENKKKRMHQKEFRDELFNRYNSTCIISGNDCPDELEAAHIVPYAENGSYDLDNGLVLTSTLHGTYDKYLWSINPKTLQIEVVQGKNVGQISKYVGKKVNLVINDKLIKNLSVHYNKFL